MATVELLRNSYF